MNKMSMSDPGLDEQKCTPMQNPGSPYSMCRIHRVRLKQVTVRLETGVEARGIECLRCPVSGKVL